MSLNKFLSKLCQYFDNKFAIDSERCLAISDWIQTFEFIDLSQFYMLILERCKYFPVIAELMNILKATQISHHSFCQNVGVNLPVDNGKYVTQGNLDEFGYDVYLDRFRQYKAHHHDRDMYIGRITSEHFREYLETGKVTPEMQTNQYFMSILRKDKKAGALVKV